MKIADTFLIEAPKSAVWDVFMDVAKLAGCVPGCNRLVARSETEYEADMEVKTKFMTIGFKANGQLKHFTEGEELVVEMTGKPLKLAGLFRTRLTVRLEERDAAATAVAYDMDVQMSGRLASLGDVMMRGTVVDASRQFAANVQRLFARPLGGEGA